MNNKIKLQIKYMSMEMTKGKNVGEVCNTILSGNITEYAKKASQFVKDAIQAVRAAPEGEDWSDEEICGKILDELEKKKKKR